MLTFWTEAATWMRGQGYLKPSFVIVTESAYKTVIFSSPIDPVRFIAPLEIIRAIENQETAHRIADKMTIAPDDKDFTYAGQPFDQVLGPYNHADYELSINAAAILVPSALDTAMIKMDFVLGLTIGRKIHSETRQKIYDWKLTEKNRELEAARSVAEMLSRNYRVAAGRSGFPSAGRSNGFRDSHSLPVPALGSFYEKTTRSRVAGL